MEVQGSGVTLQLRMKGEVKRARAQITYQTLFVP